jgi:hypothetical protein
MIGPGRYVIHYYTDYRSGSMGIRPVAFRDRVKALIGYGLLHGNAFLTLNLPFNPFCQTYRWTGHSSLFDDFTFGPLRGAIHADGYLLSTLFLTVTGSLEEADLKGLLTRAFAEAGGNIDQATQRHWAQTTAICAGKPGSRGVAWPNGACIHVEHDDGATYENWQSQTWLATQSGFEPWQHTEHPDPQTVIPPNTVNIDRAAPGQPAPQPHTVTPQPPPVPPSALGPIGGGTGLPGPNDQNTNETTKKAELYANIAKAAGVLVAAGVIVWVFNRKPAGEPVKSKRRGKR